MSLAFVTSFFYIYEKDYDNNKTITWRIERFKEIANTGIKICIYVCPTFEKYIMDLLEEFPNVKLMRTMEIKDTWISKTCVNISHELPEQKNNTKDVNDYMIVINSKTEFMEDAIIQNVWNSTHFAWIDFNISHVFFDKERSLNYLKDFGNFQFSSTFFAIPGCWQKFNNEHIGHITECIFWRFCGGFFIGDKTSVLNFHQLYKQYFPEYLEKYKKLIWEVNFWAWLEANSEWKPEWYHADHNDTIISNMSASYFSLNLRELGSSQYVYDYPLIDGYNASSASYLFYKDQHLINTRYVNYFYYNDGGYMFYDGTNIIRTKNMFSMLKDKMLKDNRLKDDRLKDDRLKDDRLKDDRLKDDRLKDDRLKDDRLKDDTTGEYSMILAPDQYIEMKETIDLQEQPFYSRNVEDIRLYNYQGKLKYIATTVGYYHTCGNRMMIGNYDIKNHCYTDSQIVEPPTDTRCEKNWVPIMNSSQTLGKDLQLDRELGELFIYKWSPLEIGEVVKSEEGKLKLNIIYTLESCRNIPFFNKLRGSAPFIEYNGYLVGIAHFSEETKPRHYFHMMIILDKDTFTPIRYSEPFVFEQIGIEFCIGFTIIDEKYWFWISQFDREPVLITLDIEKFPICREILYNDNV